MEIVVAEKRGVGEKPRSPAQKMWTLAHKGSFAVLDEGLFAGTNFVVNVLLARLLAPAEYGAFVVSYGLFTFLGTFHTAVLTEPMVVFGAGKYGKCFPQYLAILVRGHWLVTGMIGLGLGGLACVFWQLQSPLLALSLGGFAFAAPCILLAWLMRRAFYVHSQPHWAALSSGVYMVLVLGGIIGLSRMQLLSSASAILIMGGASLVLGGGCLCFLRPQRRSVVPQPASELVRTDHRRYGKWASATMASLWVSDNVYYLLLPVMVGLEGSAALRAIMNLVMPALHAVTALSTFLVPQFVKVLQTSGKDRLDHVMGMTLGVCIVGSVVYWAVLLLFRERLLWWVYDGRYVEYGGLLVMAGLIPLAKGGGSVVRAALRAMERPDLIFWGYSAALVVTMPIGLWLLTVGGVAGAVGGRLASSMATAMVLMWLCTRPALQTHVRRG